MDQEKKSSNKQYMIIGAAVVVVLGVGAFFAFKGSGVKPQTQAKQQLENAAVVPTVDPSVKADLKGKNGNKEVVLSVSGIPNGTSTIEYEFSYQTKQQGLQGLIGTIDVTAGKPDYQKEITLGTC